MHTSSDRPTIRDVARLAGVSTATVSHVINATGVISAETQQKVRVAIDALGYRPNLHARELACWRRQPAQP
jgi:DNA-binding LacI/PurR family transcriptional regulator